MQKALERDQPRQECTGGVADQEAAGAATLAGLTRALCVPCLPRLLTLRPAAGGIDGPAGALTVQMAMSLECRGPRARTCSPTCSNRVSARRGMHKRRHPACARDPVLDPHRHLARGGVK